MNSPSQRKLVLHAPGIHQGGGLRLLDSLLFACGEKFDRLQLDARIRGRLPEPGEERRKVSWIQKSFFGRLAAEWRMYRECGPEDVVLCFNGLPPLFPVKANVAVFAQNHVLLTDTSLAQYSLRIRLRLFVERLWMRMFAGNAKIYFVQSQTMANLLRARLGDRIAVRICPFHDDPPVRNSDAGSPEKKFDFIYIADGEYHKNHAKLIEAWHILATENLRPSLALTVDPGRYPALCAQINERARRDNLQITNLGVIPASEVMALYAGSHAMIFPSLFESFGLPLIEATRVGLPILASERDFVRDVANPVQTFDPESPISIARALRRFLGTPDAPVAVLSPEKFLERLCEL